MSATTYIDALKTPRRVPVDRPWVWLAEGWRDITRAPRVALGYGFGIVAASYVIVYALLGWGLLYLLLPLAGAFFLVAPLLAVGLYEASRRLHAGLPVSLFDILAAWRSPKQIAFFGVVLLIIHLAWVRMATLLFALFVGDAPRDVAQLVSATFFAQGGLAFLIVGTLIGAGFALVTFAVSAVSIPMLLDRDCDVITAIVVSTRTVMFNWQAMSLWAALIVAFTGFGIATGFVGLAVALPLIGHATWHAYRDLVP